MPPQGMPPFMQAPADQILKQLIESMKKNMVFLASCDESDANQQLSQTLLVLFPGAKMRGPQYQAVCERVISHFRNYAKGHQLIVAIPDLDPMEMFGLQMALSMMNTDQLAELSLPAVNEIPSRMIDEIVSHVEKEHGFRARRSPVEIKRCLNLTVAAHSASGLMLSDTVAQVAGGLILVESATGAPGPKARPSGWATAEIPVLILNGQEDGQNAWSSSLYDVALSAWVASRRGAQYAATHKPVIIVPGLNHGQMSGVAPNLARGDCPATQPLEVTLGRAGQAMAAFIASHVGLAHDAYLTVVKDLADMVHHTAQFYQPFAAANGVTQLSDLCRAGRELDEKAVHNNTADGPLLISSMASYPAEQGYNVGMSLAKGGISGYTPYSSATGQPSAFVEKMWSTGLMSYGNSAVPHELLAVAEREVAEMQVLVLKRAVDQGLLPGNVLPRVRIMVNLHTTQDALLYSQPDISSTPGGMVQVVVQAMLHWPLLEKPGPFDCAAFYCAGHDYWVKMKGVAAVATEICDVLGLEAPKCDACPGCEVSAADINTATLDKAMQLVTKDTRERYLNEGMQMEFVPDHVFAATDATQWIVNSRVKFNTDADEVAGSTKTEGKTVMHVVSPVFGTFAQVGSKVVALPADTACRSTWGTLCVKVLSLSQAVEWVMLGSIRHAAMPAGTPCHWGGQPVPTSAAIIVNTPTESGAPGATPAPPPPPCVKAAAGAAGGNPGGLVAVSG